MDPISVIVPDAGLDAAALDTNVLDSELADAPATDGPAAASDVAPDAVSYAARGCAEVGGLVVCDVHRQRLTFAAAQQLCAELGLSMASIRSAKQNTDVTAWAQSNDINEVMLGGSDQALEGMWLWPDRTNFWVGGSAGQASPRAFTQWGTGEPNNANMNEHCLTIYTPMAVWNDVPCSFDFPALACE